MIWTMVHDLNHGNHAGCVFSCSPAKASEETITFFGPSLCNSKTSRLDITFETWKLVSASQLRINPVLVAFGEMSPGPPVVFVLSNPAIQRLMGLEIPGSNFPGTLECQCAASCRILDCLSPCRSISRPGNWSHRVISGHRDSTIQKIANRWAWSGSTLFVTHRS